ncbi:malonyl-ACP O-methyltransferase BioC [Thermoactinomyces mirandus]|uniref:Malonyl-[acyl-carrier protein] O-methyltransferase n=1 Tax=Thermoactinomyces mirandus TaxID=2756294 RepID=A0A7W2AQP7_9BACL|nr:malonyl-ACP O-methyltransferase BioC [Thermoactinomyces mirandus]MBA4602179.1 malonyl-ACP O-methyltransferase BioC [Thermoactinomyces mirandus]
MNKKLVARRFNHSVSTYQQYASVQKEMAARLVANLPPGQRIGRILEVGCGTGYLTGLLAGHYQSAEIIAVDIAEKMVAEARKLNDCPRIRFLVGDAEANEVLQQVGPVDLIISNATIQWLAFPELTVSRWHHLLKPEGWFIASTFGSHTFRELRKAFAVTESNHHLPPSRHALSMKTKQEWQQILTAGGFHVRKLDEQLRPFVYENCRTFLRSIKATGANYSESGHSLTKERKLLQDMMRIYDQMFKTDGGVVATYHLLYLYGWKGEGSGRKW